MNTRSFLIVASCFLVSHAYAADLERGKTIFNERCVSCHGATGLGDGPVGAALPPEQKPRNLQEGAMKVATDLEKFKNLMKQGGMPLGLSALMPPQPDLGEADVAALYAYVSSLHKK